MRRAAMLLIVVVFTFVFADSVTQPHPAAGQDPEATDDGVFQLVTVTGSNARGLESGTAFFVRPDGTALTNSHVVYQAWRDPARYQLMALIGKEFFSAQIVCANRLPYDPADSKGAVYSRDVALVKVSASRFYFARWGSTREGGPQFVAHLGALPRFSPLAFGRDPVPGEPIRVVGYGFIPLSGTFGERWTTFGTVSDVGTAPDGTAVFRVASPNRPLPGNSGSPVLDGEDHVVGMWTWNEAESFAFGAAIGSSALSQGCRSVSGQKGRTDG
jgi:S1-C subfamily serine protease